jgi:hypothetical protein
MEASLVNEFGFKQVSVANWLKVDPAWGGFIMSSSLSDPSEAWVHDLAEFQLNTAIPLPVRRLFEVARGAMAYSLMFYPLLTLGSEQLLRVMETAVSEKCKALSAPVLSNYSRQVDWLVKQEVIPTNESERWKALIQLRNAASHPADQTIMPPGWALDFMKTTTELINGLFP